MRYNREMTQNEAYDTSPEAEAVLIDLIRKKPPSERLRDAIAASNRVARQCKDAIRRRHPEISEDEVNLRFIELNYGAELAQKVRTFLDDRR